jgi:hypothetical protein
MSGFSGQVAPSCLAPEKAIFYPVRTRPESLLNGQYERSQKLFAIKLATVK